jgi:uncharacterized protein
MKDSTRKFSPSVINDLKYYVYIYSHPITGEIFYVGKGKGNRVFSHLDDKSESQKVNFIREIRTKKLEPKIEILIHGLEDEETALRVESSIIDLLGIKNLTNKQIGHRSATFGRMSIEQINSAYDKRKVEIKEPSILIRINQAFRYSLTATELYDYTRGGWRLNPERAKLANYGFAIYEGIIQEVYEILNWYEAGKTFNATHGNNEDNVDEVYEPRYEFIGCLAPKELRKKYKYKSVEHYFKKGNANPIMYLNID